jgi:hypothetical protein
VTQTIGQSSIIGNYSSAPFTVSQGFQQSNWARLIFQNENQLLIEQNQSLLISNQLLIDQNVNFLLALNP